MSELDDATREVLEATLRIAEAYDRGDLAALIAAHYQGPEATAVTPGAPRPFRGWAAVREHIEAELHGFKVSRTTIDHPQVSVFGQLAVITYFQRTASRVHDIEFNWVGLVTDVLVRAEGRWLRVHHHASDLAEPQG